MSFNALDPNRLRRDEEENKKRLDLIKSWIDEVNEHGKGLTDWEENFMESLTEQFNLYGTMSPKQQDILERIRSSKTK